MQKTNPYTIVRNVLSVLRIIFTWVIITGVIGVTGFMFYILWTELEWKLPIGILIIFGGMIMLGFMAISIETAYHKLKTKFNNAERQWNQK